MAKSLPLLLVAAFLGAAVADAETPVVVFDLPLTVECRDVTPQRYEASYHRKIFEAVVKISPQLLAGEEKDLKKLHYEISTAQQMPVVSFAPAHKLPRTSPAERSPSRPTTTTASCWCIIWSRPPRATAN